MLATIPIKEGDVFFAHDGPAPNDQIKVLVVDSETTGLRIADSEAIELGGVKVVLDMDTLTVYSIEPVFSQLRQPTRSDISSKITEVTGITKDDVRGKELDLTVLYDCFFWADLVLAHNASFDRPFFEDLLPELRENPNKWACTCWDPDWTSLGFSKRKLGLLLESLGYDFPAHRAVNDCIATAWLLHLKPEVLPDILRLGLNDSFELEYKAAYKSHERVMKRLGFRRTNNKWVKAYPSMQDMFEDRQILAEHFGRFPSNQFSSSVKAVDPYSRFSSDI